MKSIYAIIITFILVSCNNTTKKKDINELKNEVFSVDTILVKIENKIDMPYDIGFIKKSFTYCWVTEKDTLDLSIVLTEYVRNNSVQLRVFNRQPILFNTAIDKINECLPLIQEDFDLKNLSSLYFEPPILYKDLTTELSQDYNNQFGQKHISYEQLDEFLMSSWLEKRISKFLDQFGKTTRRYGIEKFHLLYKEYYSEYIPNSDLNEYPEFSINGMGISVIIMNKK